MTMNNTRTPPWLIELAAQGELSETEVQQLVARLAAEGRSFGDELASLRKSNRQVLSALPRDEMAAAIRKRAAGASTCRLPSRRAPRRAAARLSMFLTPTLLAGSVAVAILMTRSPHRVGSAGLPRPPEPDEISKGDVLTSPRLVVYRQRAPGSTGPERLSDGARAARGDVLQLAYDKSPDRLFGVLLSIDGGGRITQHWPEEGARTSAPLTPVREMLLPSAYELDDAPGFERFVLICAHEAFPVAVPVDAARALIARGASAQSEPLPLGPSFGQASLLLHKIGKGAP